LVDEPERGMCGSLFRKQRERLHVRRIVGKFFAGQRAIATRSIDWESSAVVS
jgi:hypothetical protein